MEPPNFKWALPHVAILGLPDHPKMYQWMIDQGISKLYSVHSMVPKQIKAAKKLENELVMKHPYQQLSCDELLGFIDIIESAALFGKKIGNFKLFFDFSDVIIILTSLNIGMVAHAC